MKVFWSWQSDRDPKLHHYFVRDALKDACKLIAGDPEYEESMRPEVDHDTKNVAGTPDITKTILDKIDTANVFIADMTSVGTTDPAALQPNVPADERPEPKYLQNPNVMSELGYAERAISQDRIILVANGAHYPGPIALPFDWRHRSGAKVYVLKDGATTEEIKAERKRFAQVLKSCILPILKDQLPVKEPPPPIVWQPANPNDRTIWLGAKPKLKYRNVGLNEVQRSIQLSPGTRIFARVTPSEWSPPARTELEQRVSDIGLVIRARDGDWGLNNDGALSVWGKIDGARDDMIVTDATQWFQSNGEVWAVNTNCFSEHDGRVIFASALPIYPLDQFLQKAVPAIRAMGGRGPIGIRLGAGDLTDTFLSGDYKFERYEAVSDHVLVEAEQEKWTPQERRTLLLRFWNTLMDTYGRPPAASVTEFELAAALPPLSK